MDLSRRKFIGAVMVAIFSPMVKKPCKPSAASEYAKLKHAHTLREMDRIGREYFEKSEREMWSTPTFRGVPIQYQERLS